MDSFLSTINPILTYSIYFHFLSHKTCSSHPNWCHHFSTRTCCHIVLFHVKPPNLFYVTTPLNIWHSLGFTSFFTPLLCLTWKWVWIVCHVCGLQGYGTPPQYGGAYGQPYAVGPQYPGQPATVTVQPAVYVTQGPLANPVNDYLGYSIFTMLCCCLPLGIAALIYSISVSLIHKCLYSSWTGAQPWKHRAKCPPQPTSESFPSEYVPISSPPCSWTVYISKYIKTSDEQSHLSKKNSLHQTFLYCFTLHNIIQIQKKHWAKSQNTPKDDGGSLFKIKPTLNELLQ